MKKLLLSMVCLALTICATNAFAVESQQYDYNTSVKIIFGFGTEEYEEDEFREFFQNNLHQYLENGYSYYEAKGGWKSPTQYMNEDNVILFFEINDNEKDRANIKKLCETYVNAYKQNKASIYVVYTKIEAPTVYFDK